MTWLDIDTLDLKYRKGQVWRVSDTCFIWDIQAGDTISVPFVVSRECNDELVALDITDVTAEKLQECQQLWIQKQYSTFYEALAAAASPAVFTQLDTSRVQFVTSGRILLVRVSDLGAQALMRLVHKNPIAAFEHILHRIQTEPTAVVPVVRDKVAVPEEPRVPEPPKPTPELNVDLLKEHFYPIMYLGIMSGALNNAADVANVNIPAVPSSFNIQFWQNLYKGMQLEKDTVEAYKSIASKLPRDFNKVPPVVINWVGNHTNATLHTGESAAAFPDAARIFGDANTIQAYSKGRYNTAVYPTSSIVAFANAINKSEFTGSAPALYYESIEQLAVALEQGSVPVDAWCIVDLGTAPMVLVPKTKTYPISHSFIGWTYWQGYTAPTAQQRVTFYAPIIVYSDLGAYAYGLHGWSPKVKPLEAVTTDTLFVELPSYAALPRLRHAISSIEYMRDTDFVSYNISWTFYTKYKTLSREGEVQWNQSSALVIGYQTDWHEFRSLATFKENTAPYGYLVVTNPTLGGSEPKIGFPNAQESYIGREPKIINGVWKIPEGSEVTGDTRIWVDSLDAPEKYARRGLVHLAVHPDNLPKVQEDLMNLYNAWKNS